MKILAPAILIALTSFPYLANAASANASLAKFDCNLLLGSNSITGLSVQEGQMTEFDITATGFSSLHFNRGQIGIQISSGVYSTDTTNIDLASLGGYAAGVPVHLEGLANASNGITQRFQVPVKLDCLPK